jgi:folate-binding Fe-S cluster repair protein YgfZ
MRADRKREAVRRGAHQRHRRRLYLDGDASLREALPSRLERYIIADDVTLEDVSDELRLIHCLVEPGSEVPALLASKSDRFGRSGTDFLVPAGEFDTTWQALTDIYP